MVCPESGLFLLLSSDESLFYIFDFALELNPFLYQCFQYTFLPFDGLFFSLCVGSIEGCFYAFHVVIQKEFLLFAGFGNL